MSAELTMPKLSDSMADAVIIKWLKSPGEGFRRGDALIEVETDKATVVYEAEDDGTLGAILVPEGLLRPAIRSRPEVAASALGYLLVLVPCRVLLGARTRPMCSICRPALPRPRLRLAYSVGSSTRSALPS